MQDNGRGIPCSIHPSTGKSTLETVLCVLHAGGKFGGGAYKVSGGLHGVGASVVNALSCNVTAEIHREGKIYTQKYNQGIPTGKLEVTGTTEIHGTTIKFTPDPEIFPNVDFDVDWREVY